MNSPAARNNDGVKKRFYTDRETAGVVIAHEREKGCN